MRGGGGGEGGGGNQGTGTQRKRGEDISICLLQHIFPCFKKVGGGRG